MYYYIKSKKNTEKILMNPERYDGKHTTYWLQAYAICRYEYRRFCNAYLNDNVIKVQ